MELWFGKRSLPYFGLAISLFFNIFLIIIVVRHNGPQSIETSETPAENAPIPKVLVPVGQGIIDQEENEEQGPVSLQAKSEISSPEIAKTEDADDEALIEAPTMLTKDRPVEVEDIPEIQSVLLSPASSRLQKGQAIHDMTTIFLSFAARRDREGKIRIIDALYMTYSDGMHKEVKKSLIMHLFIWGDRRGFDLLLDLVNDESPEMRRWAVSMLQWIPGFFRNYVKDLGVLPHGYDMKSLMVEFRDRAMSALECQYAIEEDDSVKKLMKNVLSELKEYKVK